MNRDAVVPPNSVLPPPAHGMLGQLEVLDRHGMALHSLPILRWPVTVGRALTSDLVLADRHVAAEHLRMDTTGPGVLAVHVLDTVNGVQQGSTHYPRGTQFNWLHGQELGVGRSRLRLRLADQPLAPELPMPRFDWRNGLLTVALLLATVLVALAEVWLAVPEPSQFSSKLVRSLSLLLGITLVWAGVWALVTKIFTGLAQFWRHVRIVLGTFLGVDVLVYGAAVASFAFGWESLARYQVLLYVAVLSVGLYLQLRLMATHRRLVLVLGVACLALAGGATLVWKDKNQSSPYVSALFPPSWRLAAPVPVAQWLQEAGALRQRLDKRLLDADESDVPGADDDEEE